MFGRLYWCFFLHIFEYFCSAVVQMCCVYFLSGSLSLLSLSIDSFHLLIAVWMCLWCVSNLGRLGMNFKPYCWIVANSGGSGSPVRFQKLNFCHFCSVILWWAKVQGWLLVQELVSGHVLCLIFSLFFCRDS